MTSNIANAYLGSTPLKAIYVGDKKVYPEAEPFHAQFDLSQGTSSTTLSLPIPSNSNLRIDWGDGTTTTGTNTHTYDTIGVYDVKIYGQIRDFSYVNGGQAQKLMRIFNWGQFIITTNGVFIRCSNLIIEDLETKVNVETTDMSGMFAECSQLTTIPLLDTSNVTNMNSMFYGCSALTSIPDELDTSNVTDMAGMFGECSSLTTIPLLDTSNANNMTIMFRGCLQLTSIPDELDTSKVTNMYYMFAECSQLTTIPLLDTSNVTNMQNMFRNCDALDADLSGWCVPLITSLPTGFVSGAPLMTEEKLPIWGTCP